MKVFVTGATGFIGTQVTKELLKAGHKVLALARSDASQASLEKLDSSISILRGDLKDTETLRKGATESDGVIHLGFIHDFVFGDFSNYAESCKVDKDAVSAICDALIGKDKPFIYTSATFVLPESSVGVETDKPDLNGNPRSSTEVLALEYASKGVKSMCVRLSPTVHGEGDQAFIPLIMKVAKSKGFSGYVSDGLNSWSAVHRKDAANLYLLALENGAAGKCYHAAAELKVTTKSIAETIGKALSLPTRSVPKDEAMKHFGFLGYFLGRDKPVSSEITRRELGWQPKYPTLFEDLLGKYYSLI